MKSIVITTATALARVEKLSLSLDYEFKLAVPLNDPRIKAIHSVTRRNLAEISNRLTFAEVLQDAYNKKLPYITIFEDDVYFTRPVDPDRIAALLPKNFKVCYLGCYARAGKGNAGTWHNKTAGIAELRGTWRLWGAHAVIWGADVMKSAAVKLASERGRITDSFIYRKLIPKRKVYALIPPAVYQMPGSDGMHGKFQFSRMETESEKVFAKLKVSMG